MIYVLSQYWIFVALAFVLGLFVGWATCGGVEDGRRSDWLGWATAAFLAGLFLAGFKWIPGLPGHLLEVAMLLFAAYILGCLTGCGCSQATDDGAHRHEDGADQGAPDHAGGEAHGSGVQTNAPAPAAIAATPAAVETAARPDAAARQNAAPLAATTEIAAPPQAGMTDGRRSILAAKEKLALQRAKAATAAAVSPTPASAEAPPAPVAAPASSLVRGAPAPRSGMTDGQRSIIAARRKMAEKAASAALSAAQAEAPAANVAAAGTEGSRPAADSRPDAPSDDLKLIKGVGPKNEAALNGLGVRRFADIADWSGDNEIWVGHFIEFPGRIEREHWVAQARLLAAGIETPHAAAVKSGAIRIDDSADAPLSEAEAAQLVRALPQQAPKVEDEHAYAGARPLGLAAPKSDKADDLKLIKGIGRQNEERLHKLGVWHFDQIAAWTPANVKWIGSYLAFPGRIDRERWIEQAISLARGELTEFAKRVEAGDVPTSSSGAAARAEKLI